MKRTTYMIAGLLLAGLMSICGTMLLLRFYSTPYNHQEELERLTIPLKGEPTAVGLPPCRVIQIEAADNSIPGHRLWSNCALRVVSAGNNKESILTIPSDLQPLLHTSVLGDTLFIRIQTPPYRSQEQKEYIETHHGYPAVQSDEWILALSAQTDYVASHLPRQKVIFSGLSRDSLAFCVDRGVVEESQFRALKADGRELRFKSGSVQHLHTNLDGNIRWILDEKQFHLDTEHLSGSGWHQWSLLKGECRRLLWQPLTKEATLQVTLHEGAILEQR